MLYVFYGIDTRTAVGKAHSLVDSLRAKRPDAAFAKIEADSWDPAAIEGHLGGQGLFSSKYIVFMDRVSENAEAKELLPGLLAAMQESPNIFIVLEGKPNAELKRAFEKNAEKIVECEPRAAAEKKEEFNIFALTSAFANRDALKAWRIYREAIDAGTAVENILGLLFWKAKSIADKGLAREIMILYHEGHRGRRDLELATEQCILNCAKTRP